MPNSAVAFRLVEAATKCLATAPAVWPAAASNQSRGAGVGQGFQRVEGFAGDDKQRRAWIQAGQRAGQIGAVQIGDEMYIDVGLLLGGERLHDHARAEIRAADAEIYHVGDVFAGEAAPLAAMHGIAEFSDTVQDDFDFGRRTVAGTQVDVTNGALFGVIDRLAGLHALDPAGQIGACRQVAQMLQRFAGHALLREIKQ